MFQKKVVAREATNTVVRRRPLGEAQCQAARPREQASARVAWSSVCALCFARVTRCWSLLGHDGTVNQLFFFFFRNAT